MEQLTQKEFNRLKGRLTRRVSRFVEAKTNLINLSGPDRPTCTAKLLQTARDLQAEARYGLDVFTVKGHPDDWHRWERALDDAKMALAVYGTRF